MRVKLAEDKIYYNQQKQEVDKKRLQKLLNTDIDDFEELEKMWKNKRKAYNKRIKENKEIFKDHVENKPSLLPEEKLRVDQGIETDIKFTQGHGIQNKDLDGLNENPQDIKEDNRYLVNLNYLNGSEVYDAMNNLEEEQIKEYFPLTDLKISNENGPEWVKDYKRI